MPLLFFARAVNAETSCQKQRRQMLLAKGYTRDARQYLPRCTVSGEYNTVQCRSMNQCWCVDERGRRFSENMPEKRANSLVCSLQKRKRRKY